MRAVIQRVTSAKVEVEGKVTGEIEKGFLILFGVGQEDTETDCDKLADKISKLRIFADENDKTNLSFHIRLLNISSDGNISNTFVRLYIPIKVCPYIFFYNTFAISC